ncbi:MAG: dockerin type I domain-containing protein, partial [Oscillospiraceae bacterium]|nr:dockerin type I domain-containing protein [Oscillospiraceae bacterium]
AKIFSAYTGIFNLGTLTAENVTIYGTRYVDDDDYYGYGIYDESDEGSITLTDCNLGGSEYGVSVYSAKLTMTNCSEYTDSVTANSSYHYFVESSTETTMTSCTGSNIYAAGVLAVSNSTLDSVEYIGSGNITISGSTINNYLYIVQTYGNRFTGDCTISNTAINGNVGYSDTYAVYLSGYSNKNNGVEDNTITFSNCTVNDNGSVSAVYIDLENVIFDGGTYGTINFNNNTNNYSSDNGNGSVTVKGGAIVDTINAGKSTHKNLGTITLTSGTLGAFNDYIADTDTWKRLSIGEDMQFKNSFSQVSVRNSTDLVTDLNDYIEGALVKAEGSDYYKLDSSVDAPTKENYTLTTPTGVTQTTNLVSGKAYPAGTVLTVTVTKVTSPYIFEGWTVTVGEGETAVTTTYGTDGVAVTADEGMAALTSEETYTLSLTLTGEETTVTPIVNNAFSDATEVTLDGDTYEIDSVGDYLYMAELSYEGETFSGKTIKVTGDISFKEKTFYPIGTNTAFQGTFDGNSQTIKEITYTAAIGNAGIIANASGATIKDLTVTDSTFTFAWPQNVGGIVGYISGGTTTVSGCSVKDVNLIKADGTSEPYGGGIVGMISNSTEDYDKIYNVSVDNVLAYGNIVGRIDGYAKLDNVTVANASGSASLIGRVGSASYSDVIISNINVSASDLPLIYIMCKNDTLSALPTVTITSGSDAVLGNGAITTNTVAASALVGTMGNVNSAEGASLTISEDGTASDTYTIDSVVDTQNYAATLLIKSGTYSEEIKSYVASGYYRYTDDSGETTYVVGTDTKVTYESSISAHADSNVSLDDESITVNQNTSSTAIISGADTATQEYANNDTTTGGTITYVHSDEVTYLDVTNETYENNTSYKSVTMDVTPYIIVKVDGTETSKEELNLEGQTVTVRLPLPNDFFTVNSKVYVKHTHGNGTELLRGTVQTKTDGTTTYTYVDVTTDKGFSEFQLYSSLNVTDGISVVLAEHYDTDNGGNLLTEPTKGVYDINLVADDASSGYVIYRFMSAQFEFDISDTNVAYTIAPASNINLVTAADGDETVYGFYADDTNHGITNSTITLGTVTFVGVSDEFDFWVQGTDEYSETKVVTAIYDAADNNLIRTFTEDGYGYSSTDPTTGKLTIDNEANTTDEDGDAILDNISLSLDLTTLKINVVFPNSVDSQATAYNDIEISLSNVLGDDTIYLGNDVAGTDYTVTYGKAEIDNTEYTAYVVTTTVPKEYATKLEFNGAGYRTYRTSITPTDDATVTVWNNAMDSEDTVVIDESYDAMGGVKDDVTFLAGDIVMDYNINLYDLSAVVSYFGKTTTTADYDAYAKYDLNRDGKIDSKDIAMVLVSWDK